MTVFLILIAAGCMLSYAATVYFITSYTAVAPDTTEIAVTTEQDSTPTGNAVRIMQPAQPDSQKISQAIESVAIEPRDDESILSFQLTGMASSPKVYVWTILNPGAETEPVELYPRNPVFRGLPVDFRNGIPIETLDTETIHIPLPVRELKQFRLLIYSLEGDIIIDNSYSVGSTAVSEM